MRELAYAAGAAILEVYRTDFDSTRKDDGSPVTLADTAAEAAIVPGLRALTPEIPVVSEEEHSAGRSPTVGNRFWLVDPLDGTREFLKRNDEFTVNIALMARNGDTEWYPRLGVVYAPALGELFVGREDSAFYWSDIAPSSPPPSVATGETLPRAGYNDGRPFTIVASRSHMSGETEEFVETRRREHPDLELVSAGSSLKLCRVADGSADEYPRFAPTMEWDTAAGDAVARSAGCEVRIWDGERNRTAAPLEYNKEDLHNPWFLVRRT